MLDTFFTIKENEYSAEIVEKKSKFIAVLAKVNSEKEALEKLEKIIKDAKNKGYKFGNITYNTPMVTHGVNN